VTPQIITIIVRTTITRFPANNPNYLAYMIGKLSTETPSINQHRTNLRAYLKYKDAQTRIKEHELAIHKKAAANKKKRSKKTIGSSCVDPETWEAIQEGEREKEAIKKANRKEIARKKVESANKKATAATKKERTAANKAAAAGTKAEKAKKTSHSKNIEDLAEAIQGLFEEDIVDQLNAKLQAAVSPLSPRHNHRPQRTERAPPRRYL
jgi:wobble nucleotide-excising tRNase